MKKVIFLLFILSMQAPQAQTIDHQIQQIRQAHNIPQLTYAVITQDSILSLGTSGTHKSTDTQSHASLVDYFHLGSNSKAITAFIAATLVQEGLISWNTTYFDLYPEAKKQANPAYYKATLADFLSHRAGVHAYTNGSERLALPSFTGTKQQQRTAFSQFVLTQDPIETKEPYFYSNAGYSIAASMLEKVTNKSWETLVQEVLGDELHLNYVIGWPNRNLEDQPWGHALSEGELTPVPPTFEYNLSLIEPAGDLSMTVFSYIKYIQLNLAGLAGANNVLSAALYRDLFSTKYPYALGWAVTKKDKHIQYEHAGSDGTFFSYCLIDTATHKAYILLANSGTPQAQEGVAQTLKVLRQHL
ncbi:serine hydrolase domain-containing protein [Myroides sp. C15-4]|uniref:serine hydrolase domain-containing protein n=1 Tax=Myroides sp. C15-4 TaxID=3400532 RepID=UPI003D2F8EB3